MAATISEPIRVMLVEDHPMVCRGLTIFLMAFDYLQLVGQAESGKDAIQLCAKVLPDVILMDMDMSGMDGAATTRAIHQEFPDVRIIALTSLREGNLIKKELDAGLMGYLLKDMSADQLAGAICAAVYGRATISAEAAQALFENLCQQPEPGRNLTECEREVLALMVDGLNNTQIAGKLVVSSSTIKMHVSNILAKLCIVSHARAVTLILPNRTDNFPSPEFCPINRRDLAVSLLSGEKVSTGTI